MDTGITIRTYSADDQHWFESLNRQWIDDLFEMEPVDSLVLKNPEEYIIKPGGMIFMADAAGTVAGTAALKYVSSGIYEFTKMAVAPQFRGRKIGEALSLAALAAARQRCADEIILYSNTVLVPAIELYRKLGFTEVQLDGPYKRSNIKMLLKL